MCLLVVRVNRALLLLLLLLYLSQEIERIQRRALRIIFPSPVPELS